LSSQFQQAEQLRLLRGVPTSQKRPRLNYLFLVDGSLLFCKASVIEWKVLSSVLEGYERASGQRLNKDKTLVFFFFFQPKY
jgi:hypothetical protein